MSKKTQAKKTASAEKKADDRHGHNLILLAVREQIAINEAEATIKQTREATGVNAMRENISTRMFAVAKQFTRNGSFDLIAWLHWCELEEEYIKSDSAGDNKVDKLPRCWVQAKSNIKQGAEKFGLSPLDYESESAYRTAKNEAGKAARKGQITDEHDAPEGMAVDARLAQRFVAIANICESRGDISYDSAVDMLDDLIIQLKEELVGSDVVAPEEVSAQAA